MTSPILTVKTPPKFEPFHLDMEVRGGSEENHGYIRCEWTVNEYDVYQ